jgi:hypothetical protein
MTIYLSGIVCDRLDHAQAETEAHLAVDLYGRCRTLWRE